MRRGISTRKYNLIRIFHILLSALPYSLCFERIHFNSKSRRSFSALSLSSNDGLQRNAVHGTTAILRVSFDGTRFTGWSNANNETQKHFEEKTSKRALRRSRQTVGQVLPKGYVRSVQGVIRNNLARIYGNVDPRRIIVEGCSRTDKGVHAQAMMAQFYCLRQGVLEELEGNEQSLLTSSIPGKKIPHPLTQYDDSYFEKLPMDGNLSRIAFALNRMRPSDVQIAGIAPLPESIVNDGSSLPFHPTLSCNFKQYVYRISTGLFADPTAKRLSWYVGQTIDIESMNRVCQLLQGRHSFTAFRGAPRGHEDRAKFKSEKKDIEVNSCTLFRIEIIKDIPPAPVYFPGVNPPIETYKIIVEGDRFLYKMMRFIVGALVAVGNKKLEYKDVERALSTGNWDISGSETRRREFQVAPAHGLVLADVNYGSLKLDWQPLQY